MPNIIRWIEKIVIHCSDSDFGDASLLDSWHRGRGFDCIGYHFVILNAYPTPESIRLHRPEFWRDGVVETGRSLDIPGAHVRGHNHNSIGICLIGRNCFTLSQYESLNSKLGQLYEQFPEAKLYGHYELIRAGAPPKSCPNLDMDYLRGLSDVIGR